MPLRTVNVYCRHCRTSVTFWGTMSKEQPDRQIPATTENRPAKKKYEKPEARFERVFETMALSCGKIQTTNQQCKFNRKSS